MNLCLFEFARHEFTFKPKEGADDVRVRVESRGGEGIPINGFVPMQGYTLQLIEGEERNAWLTGELDGYHKNGMTTWLLFGSIANSREAHGPWKLGVVNIGLWTCPLIGGKKYSLMCRPVEAT